MKARYKRAQIYCWRLFYAETPVVGWNVNDDCLDHLWMVKSVLGETDTYRIQNLVSGTYMDLAGSKLKAHRTLIILQVSPSRFGFERHADHWIPQDEPGGEPEMDNQERNDRNPRKTHRFATSSLGQRTSGSHRRVAAESPGKGMGKRSGRDSSGWPWRALVYNVERSLAHDQACGPACVLFRTCGCQTGPGQRMAQAI